MECTGVLFKKITVIKNLEQSYFYHFKHNDEEYVIDASVTGNLARYSLQNLNIQLVHKIILISQIH